MNRRRPTDITVQENVQQDESCQLYKKRCFFITKPLPDLIFYQDTALAQAHLLTSETKFSQMTSRHSKSAKTTFWYFLSTS
jgi:hypothetical protein